MLTKMRYTFIEYTVQKVKATIYLGNVKRNAQSWKILTGKPLCAVVKANAYGHGAEEIVCALSGIADMFAVALVEEGLAIRQTACGKKILVLTPPLTEEDAYVMACNRFIASVTDVEGAKLLSTVCRKYELPIHVHLKINTGMNRYGLSLSELEKVCAFFKEDGGVMVAGVYSHLYDTEYSTALAQRGLFLRAVAVCKRYFPKAVAHLSATYGCLLGKDFAFDMIRVGLGLYGYLPNSCPNEFRRIGESLGLQQAMRISAAVVQSGVYTFGGAGYGAPLLTDSTSLSTIRIGYADGCLRNADNGLQGCETQLRPSCMDASIRAATLGRGEWQTVMEDADEVAKRTGTVSYEVLCAATRRAEFIYEND